MRAGAASLKGGRRIWPWAVGAAAVAAVVAGVFAYRAATAQPGVSQPDQGNRHIQTLNETIPPYNSEPPTSGAVSASVSICKIAL